MWSVRVVLRLCVILAIPAYPQGSAELPPDLAHVELSADSPSCRIVEHSVAETINARTKEVAQLYKYRSEPSARYDDGRSWTLPLEAMSNSKTQRPGAIADSDTSGAAADACLAWIKQAQKAAIEARKKK